MSDRDIPVSKADNSVEPELAPTMRERGKPFEKGNGGRKPGSRNRTTVIASALMEGQEAELVQTGLALAKAGNIPMLKLFLERMLPKEPPIHLELPPLRTLSDAKEAMALITKAMAEGKISPSQGAAVASVTDRFTRAVEFTEISKKVADLEEKLNSDWALLKEQAEGYGVMISRRRQIGRLERLARPVIEKRGEMILERTLRAIEQFNEDGLTHASNLVLLITYGKPEEGEPLLQAWDRCLASEAPELGDMLTTVKKQDWNPFDDADDARWIGQFFRQKVLSKLEASGNNNAERLVALLSHAPRWLLWFTYADFTFEALGTGLSDTRDLAEYARSRLDYMRWPLLPRGAFHRQVDRVRVEEMFRLMAEDPSFDLRLPQEVRFTRKLKAILERYGRISGFHSPLFDPALQRDPDRLELEFNNTLRHWIPWH